jgi:hypothetical protein
VVPVLHLFLRVDGCLQKVFLLLLLPAEKPLVIWNPKYTVGETAVQRLIFWFDHDCLSPAEDFTSKAATGGDFGGW